MARSHCDVGASEIKERLGQCGLVICITKLLENGDVRVQGWCERLVQQVFHHERFGEVGPRLLPGSRLAMQINLSSRDFSNGSLPRGTNRHVNPFAVQSQILFRQGQLRLQQTFVDGAEFTHRKCPKVHWPNTFRSVIDEQGVERGTKLVVGQC